MLRSNIGKKANQFWIIISLVLGVFVLIIFFLIMGSNVDFFNSNTGCESTGGRCVESYSDCKGEISTVKCSGANKYCCLDS